jgi:hypothetical protein
LRRGPGATVRETASPGVARVRDLARELLTAGRRLGMSVDDVVDIVKAVA